MHIDILGSFHMPCTSKAARTKSLNIEIQETGQHIHIFKDSAPELTSAPEVAITSSKTSIAPSIQPLKTVLCAGRQPS